jgi:hypothetical protein
MKRLIICFCMLTLALPVFGQSNYATVTGRVTDPQRLPVPGATIQLKMLGTGAIRRIVTNDQGLFEAPGLLPDDYELQADAAGFVPTTQSVRLEVGQRVAIDITLNVQSLTQDIEVLAQIDILHTTNATVGEVVEPQSIRELPLNGRMLIDLILTVPGAHIGAGAQQGNVSPLYWRPGQRSAVSIGGNRPNANFFLLDGATNTDPTFNTQNLSLSPDAVKEFQVQTNSYSADLGGAGGGQINIVTHSGTNSYHGTLYEFHRNGALDAATFESMGNKHLVQNNFGGSLGGPAGANTFFFGNYEGLRHAMTVTNIATVPTSFEIMGDFSHSGHAIYDPASSPRIQFSTNGRLNVIPPARINRGAQLFLEKYVPRPNLETSPGDDSNNYLDVRNEVQIHDQGTIRVDHVFNKGDTIFGRYSLGGEHGFTPENLPGFGSRHDNLSQQAVVSWNRIFSSGKINTLAIAVSRLSMDRTSENNGKNDIVSELGIQGVGFGGQGAWGAPWFAIQGYSGMGDSYAATPVHAWDTMYELRDTFSWQQGRHGLKFGGSFRRYVWPMWGFFQNRGYYQFTNGFATGTATNDGTGSALASFLLGLPAVKQRQAGIPQMDLRNWGTDGFAEDSWQATSTTTINFGLRYEYSSPLYDKKYTNTNLIFQNGVPFVFVGGQLGYPKGLMYSNKHDFAPRVGITKNIPNLGLVLHSAYGIFYTPVDLNTWCNQRHNVPYVFPETQQSDNFTPPASLFGSAFNFAQPVLGQTTVSFTAFDPHSPAQYVQQWNAWIEKELGSDTTLQIGYLGSRGIHLQRSHLINNAPPGPGPIGPRRPFQQVSFVPDTVLPSNINVAATTFPVSGINRLEDTARSWYDSGYINLRRRYAHGLSFLANYTFAKSLTDAPDFRSAMDESAIPQDNKNLRAEKGLACDIRHRFALSMVFDIPAIRRSEWLRRVSGNWHLSTVYQIQSGFPFTVSVFGDTANAGTLLGENPIRAQSTGQPVFGPGTRRAEQWFNSAAFTAPAAFSFGNVGRNTVYGPPLKNLDVALQRSFRLTEKLDFQFRGEFFNALNQVNLGTPNRFVNEPQFGTITMAATPGREIQLSARLSF